MPVPTEVLNEDIKELKIEVREIRSNLDVLRADVHRVDVGLGELRAEFGFAKWLLGLTLAITLTGTVNGIWTTATLTNEVKHISADMAEMRNTITLMKATPTAFRKEEQAPPVADPDPAPEMKRLLPEMKRQ